MREAGCREEGPPHGGTYNWRQQFLIRLLRARRFIQPTTSTQYNYIALLLAPRPAQGAATPTCLRRLRGIEKAPISDAFCLARRPFAQLP
jgi:hypothetical protein